MQVARTPGFEGAGRLEPRRAKGCNIKSMFIACVADAAIRCARSDARCPGRVVSRDEALADPRFADIFFIDAVIFNTDREVVG